MPDFEYGRAERGSEGLGTSEQCSELCCELPNAAEHRTVFGLLCDGSCGGDLLCPAACRFSVNMVPLGMYSEKTVTESAFSAGCFGEVKGWSTAVTAGQKQPDPLVEFV